MPRLNCYFSKTTGSKNQLCHGTCLMAILRSCRLPLKNTSVENNIHKATNLISVSMEHISCGPISTILTHNNRELCLFIAAHFEKFIQTSWHWRSVTGSNNNWNDRLNEAEWSKNDSIGNLPWISAVSEVAYNTTSLHGGHTTPAWNCKPGLGKPWLLRRFGALDCGL